MTIEEIKRHGAILGLEAELNTRISQIKGAYEKKDWTWVTSHATVIKELAEELRNLKRMDEKK